MTDNVRPTDPYHDAAQGALKLMERLNTPYRYEIAETIRTLGSTWPVRQDAVADQLADLLRLAVKLGMYDAADWITQKRG